MLRRALNRGGTVVVALRRTVRDIWNWIRASNESTPESRWQVSRRISFSVTVLVAGTILGYVLSDPHLSAFQPVLAKAVSLVGVGATALWGVSARRCRVIALRRRGKSVPRFPITTWKAVSVLICFALAAALGWYASQQRRIVEPPRALTAKAWINSPVYRANDGLAEQVGVANVTAGGTGYSTAIHASYDQVVKIVLMYFGCSAPNPIYNITPEVAWPNATGENSEITIRLTDASGAHLSASAIVHLSDPRERLVYISDSAVWDHSTSHTDQSFKEQLIGDSALTSRSPLENIAPNGGGSVTFLMRDVTPSAEVSVSAKGSYSSDWSSSLEAPRGTVIDYNIKIENNGDMPLSQVSVADQLPNWCTYVKGSTVLLEPKRSKEIKLPDGIVHTLLSGTSWNGYAGIYLPSVQPSKGSAYFRNLLQGESAELYPGQTLTIAFKAEVDAAAVVNDASEDFAIVRSLGNPVYWGENLFTVEPA